MHWQHRLLGEPQVSHLCAFVMLCRINAHVHQSWTCNGREPRMYCMQLGVRLNGSLLTSTVVVCVEQGKECANGKHVSVFVEHLGDKG